MILNKKANELTLQTVVVFIIVVVVLLVMVIFIVTQIGGGGGDLVKSGSSAIDYAKNFT